MHELTGRELEVARLIGQGMTQQEIADQLDISYRTVKSVTERVRWKLGVSKSREIPRVLKELGMIDK